MRSTIIYALIDPRDGYAKYVGKTVQSSKQRLSAHISFARKKAHTFSARWILGLLKSGQLPEIAELETVESDWQEAEIFWIAYLRYLGCTLTNHTGGGDGLHMHRHSDEAKLNMSIAQKNRFAEKGCPLKGRARPELFEVFSAAQKGRILTPEHRAKLAEALRGNTIPAEVRKKISASNLGKHFGPQTAEHKRKISEKAKGRIAPPEVNAKISAALKGRKMTDEHRKNLSEAAKRRHAREAK